jgi:predicted DNA-binding transcriptional regulator AlpA
MDKLLTEAEVQEILGVSRSTLAGWRSRGQGPAFLKAGPGKSFVRYPRAELERWIAEHTRRGDESEETP